MQKKQSEILQGLQEGNARFVAGKRKAHDFLAQAKETAKKGQKPTVTILSCSDSRVPTEIIFDQGIGDVFSVRIAGNVCQPSQLGAVEFGTKYLGTPLCVVLGHTKCGAVVAACTGMQLEKNIQSLVKSISPAAKKTEKKVGKTGKEIVEDCAEENIFTQIEYMLKKSDVLRELVRTKKLAIVGANYDLETGVVKFLGAHPKNDELIAG